MIGAVFQVCYYYEIKSYPEVPLFKSFQAHWQYIDRTGMAGLANYIFASDLEH